MSGSVDLGYTHTHVHRTTVLYCTYGLFKVGVVMDFGGCKNRSLKSEKKGSGGMRNGKVGD